jgi:hypothetical protein
VKVLTEILQLNHAGKSNAPLFSDLSQQHLWPSGCF